MIVTIHDLYLWKLTKEISSQYDQIITNHKLIRKKRVVAEIDIIAIKKNQIDVYEIKCSNRSIKAKKQFKKIKKYYDKKITNYYLFCGNANKLVKIKV